jgi:hypothetical protein
MSPSPQYRQCTSDLKRGPVDKFIRSLPHKVMLSGFIPCTRRSRRCRLGRKSGGETRPKFHPCGTQELFSRGTRSLLRFISTTAMRSMRSRLSNAS